jgi:hypothetical protein
MSCVGWVKRSGTQRSKLDALLLALMTKIRLQKQYDGLQKHCSKYRSNVMLHRSNVMTYRSIAANTEAM